LKSATKRRSRNAVTKAGLQLKSSLGKDDLNPSPHFGPDNWSFRFTRVAVGEKSARPVMLSTYSPIVTAHREGNWFMWNFQTEIGSRLAVLGWTLGRCWRAVGSRISHQQGLSWSYGKNKWAATWRWCAVILFAVASAKTIHILLCVEECAVKPGAMAPQDTAGSSSTPRCRPRTSRSSTLVRTRPRPRIGVTRSRASLERAPVAVQRNICGGWRSGLVICPAGYVLQGLGPGCWRCQRSTKCGIVLTGTIGSIAGIRPFWLGIES